MVGSILKLVLVGVFVANLTGCIVVNTPPGTQENGSNSSAPSPSSSSAADCSTDWGANTKSADRTVTAPITAVAVEAQDCFDRLVVTTSAASDGYLVQYVDSLMAEGSGMPVELRGGAILRVNVAAPAYDVNTGDPTFTPGNPSELADVSGFGSFRQVAWAGSFEGQTLIGIGLDSEHPFRVTISSDSGGTHLIIDVAH
ncbi:MAG: hypothetical protein IT191_08890 [Microbacteriaceae bacterium]|nr:hypothetical protein [Microbacteriaceae bacterium]